jgi:hypothetical protein
MLCIYKGRMLFVVILNATLLNKECVFKSLQINIVIKLIMPNSRGTCLRKK